MKTIPNILNRTEENKRIMRIESSTEYDDNIHTMHPKSICSFYQKTLQNGSDHDSIKCYLFIVFVIEAFFFACCFLSFLYSSIVEHIKRLTLVWFMDIGYALTCIISSLCCANRNDNKIKILFFFKCVAPGSAQQISIRLRYIVCDYFSIALAWVGHKLGTR